jgi:hypothetical protein
MFKNRTNAELQEEIVEIISFFEASLMFLDGVYTMPAGEELDKFVANASVNLDKLKWSEMAVKAREEANKNNVL